MNKLVILFTMLFIVYYVMFLYNFGLTLSIEITKAEIPTLLLSRRPLLEFYW